MHGPEVYNMIRVMADQLAELGFTVDASIEYPGDPCVYTFRSRAKGLTEIGQPAILRLELHANTDESSYFAGGTL